MKQLPKYLRILRRAFRPHPPQLVAQRISHKLIGLVLMRVVLRRRRLRVRVFARVEFLRRQQAQVLAPEVAAQGRGVAARFVG